MTDRRLSEITRDQLVFSEFKRIDLGWHQTEKNAIDAALLLQHGTTKLREIKTPGEHGRYFATIRRHHVITFNLDSFGRILFLRKYS